MRNFKCDKCGNVYEMIEQKSGCTPVCCGSPTRELKAGEVDAAMEKHVPVLSQENDTLIVKVGSVPHPMQDVHYIINIWAEFEDGSMDRISLVPGQAPEASIALRNRKGHVVVYEYCNLHGLWKAEMDIA